MSKRLPSPALVIALVALFVALGGTGVAAAIVPLAKRALVADVAKKLGTGASASLVARASQTPGPASSAAGLLTIKSAAWSLGPNAQSDLTVMCDAGQKAVSGGFEDPGGYGHSWDSRPANGGSGWRTFVTIGPDASGPQTGTVFAICVK